MKVMIKIKRFKKWFRKNVIEKELNFDKKSNFDKKNEYKWS